jgi:hypothetical protein
MAKDKVCMDVRELGTTSADYECTDSSFEFIAVNNAINQLSKIEYGVIGLRPDTSTNFITALVSGSNEIELKVFTTRMVSAYFDSYIEFGRTDKINRL